MRFIPGMSNQFNINTQKSINVISYLYGIKDKPHRIVSIHEKKIDKISHSFMIKNIQETRNERELPQPVKGQIPKKPHSQRHT